MSNYLDRSPVNVAIAIIAHSFEMSLFHDAYVVMRSFPVWISNKAKDCFPETLEWLFYLVPESLNDRKGFVIGEK